MEFHGEKIFLDYASGYDRKNGKIHLKIVHTLEVAKGMDRLTEKMHLGEEMRGLAHICAVFHDIGRLEQAARYDTFLDHLSVDHADLGCEVLRREGFLGSLPEEHQERILTAIRNHNKFRIEEGLEPETLFLCKLIRDADKMDIFRVFACEDMVDTMGETIEEVEKETLTDCVYEAILAHQCVEKSMRKTGLDKWAGFLSFFFDMYFPESFALLCEERYYRRPFERANFRLPETRRRVQRMLDEIEAYLQEQGV